jgi:hypothetical protein
MNSTFTPGWFFSAAENAFAFLITDYGFRPDSCTFENLCFSEVFKNDVVGIQIVLNWDGLFDVNMYKLIGGKIPHTEVNVDPSLYVEYQRATILWIAHKRGVAPKGITGVIKHNRESVEIELQAHAALLADIGADFLRGRFESYADLYVDETKHKEK